MEGMAGEKKKENNILHPKIALIGIDWICSVEARNIRIFGFVAVLDIQQ